MTAPVVVVHGWDELAARAAEVKGAIVLYERALAIQRGKDQMSGHRHRQVVERPERGEIHRRQLLMRGVHGGQIVVGQARYAA